MRCAIGLSRLFRVTTPPCSFCGSFTASGDGNLLRDLTTGHTLEDHEIFPALCAGHAIELETWTTQGHKIITGVTSQTIPGALLVHWWIPNPPLY